MMQSILVLPKIISNNEQGSEVRGFNNDIFNTNKGQRYLNNNLSFLFERYSDQFYFIRNSDVVKYFELNFNF